MYKGISRVAACLLTQPMHRFMYIHPFILWRLIPLPGQVCVCFKEMIWRDRMVAK